MSNNNYFFIFVKIIFYSSEIVIPFYSKLSEVPKNEAPINFLNYLTTNELYTKVKIGSPSQEFNFLVDFDNYNTYIIKDQNPGKRYIRFIDNISSTFTSFGNKLYYSDSDFSFAINASDLITIGETLNNYIILFFKH